MTIPSSTDVELVWGLNYGHDASIAAVVRTLEPQPIVRVVVASHTERFNRIKNSGDICKSQIQWTLDQYPYAKPSLILETDILWKSLYRELRYGTFARYQEVRNQRIRNRALIEEVFRERNIPVPKYSSMGHHLSHAWAAYGTLPRKFFSPSTLVVVVDAVGELTTGISYYNSGSNLVELPSTEMKYPQSLGLFYSAYTQALGFKPNEEEYQVMALGTKGFLCKLEFSDRNPIPAFTSPWEAKHYHRGLSTEEISKVKKLKKSEGKRVVASIIQRKFTSALHTYVYRCLNAYRDRVGTFPRELILTGGCALNCVATSNLARSLASDYKYQDIVLRVYHNPGDAGSSIGAALAYFKQPVFSYTPYLGPLPSNPKDDTDQVSVEDLVQNILKRGWTVVNEGPDEFGPRALGNRSILADPRIDKKKLDRIKKRQSFRPYGIVIFAEDLDKHFQNIPRKFVEANGPYMNVVLTAKTLTHSRYPAAVHVDCTSRVQVLNNRWYSYTRIHEILKEWKRVSGVDFLINTSANKRGEPK